MEHPPPSSPSNMSSKTTPNTPPRGTKRANPFPDAERRSPAMRLSPAAIEEKRDRSRDNHRDRGDRDKEREKDKERDKERDRDRDRERDRDRDRDRDSYRARSRSRERPRDRADRYRGTGSRDRDRYRGDRYRDRSRSRDRDRDRFRDRSRDRRDRDRDRSRERSRSRFRYRDRSRDRSRDRYDRSRDRSVDRYRDRYRSRSRDRRDRDRSRDRERDRERERERERDRALERAERERDKELDREREREREERERQRESERERDKEREREREQRERESEREKERERERREKREREDEERKKEKLSKEATNEHRNIAPPPVTPTSLKSPRSSPEPTVSPVSPEILKVNFKKRGHFDGMRKDVLNAFNESDFKPTFISKITALVDEETSKDAELLTRERSKAGMLIEGAIERSETYKDVEELVDKMLHERRGELEGIIRKISLGMNAAKQELAEMNSPKKVKKGGKENGEGNEKVGDGDVAMGGVNGEESGGEKQEQLTLNGLRVETKSISPRS